MNFMIEGAEGLQVTAYGDTDSLRISGKDKARFPIGKWKKLLLQQKGKSVQVRVTALMKGKWLEYPSFQWQVAAEAIDGYLSYRLIEPGYEVWNNLQLCERSLEDFSEKVIADNKLTGGNYELSYLRKAKRSAFHVSSAWEKRRNHPQPRWKVT